MREAGDHDRTSLRRHQGRPSHPGTFRPRSPPRRECVAIQPCRPQPPNGAKLPLRVSQATMAPESSQLLHFLLTSFPCGLTLEHDPGATMNSRSIVLWPLTREFLVPRRIPRQPRVTALRGKGGAAFLFVHNAYRNTSSHVGPQNRFAGTTLVGLAEKPRQTTTPYSDVGLTLAAVAILNCLGSRATWSSRTLRRRRGLSRSLCRLSPSP